MGDKQKEPNKKGGASERTKTKSVPVDEQQSSFFDLRTKSGQILFITVTVLATVLVQLVPREAFTSVFLTVSPPATVCQHGTLERGQNVPTIELPTYAFFGRNPDGGHLIHVQKVLERLGVQRVDNRTADNDWDLLWAHDYPFRKMNLYRMQPHQLVNHFPGSGYITNKVDLSTTKVRYIPAAFKLPADEQAFREYVASVPGKQFVQKNNQHRHIQIRTLEEMDFGNNETFIQEFIDDPLLVDGYKFDIGVYTVITSVNPLRLYIYKGDILFRYCPVKYYPFNASDVDKYIVGDDYLPTWEVPSLKQYYTKLGFGMKDSFDAYLRSTGRDPSHIWEQVEDAIRLLVLKKEPLLAGILPRYASKRNFFEMMRFDLVVDNKLQVYLMEANMSPNLSSAHFKPNRLLYEQVIYNLLRLVGVGSDLQRSSFSKQQPETEAMLSSLKNVVTDANRCSELPCAESCAPEECQLCISCLNSNDLRDLHAAYREHMNRGDMKRIFPVPMDDRATYDSMSTKNKLMMRWFEAKCAVDRSYCG